MLHRPAERISAIEAILQDAEALLDVRLTLHDLSGVFVDAEGGPLLDRVRGSHRRYATCGYGHGRRCVEHCYAAVGKRAAASEGAFVHRCWKGIVELAQPLHRGGVHVGTLFAGQWRPTRLRLPGGLDRRAAGAIRALPVADEARLERLGALLGAVADGLLARVERLRRLDGPAPSRPQAIRRFLELHAAEGVRLADLADALHLSPSRTSHLVRELTGRTFQDLLVGERLRRGRALLRSTDLPVGRVARLVGLDNACYFSRLFRARTGATPTAYRRQGPTGRGDREPVIPRHRPRPGPSESRLAAGDH
ncbi:MAG: helix-turn-helix domain-containing protein [Planctomycetota bacterium]